MAVSVRLISWLLFLLLASTCHAATYLGCFKTASWGTLPKTRIGAWSIEACDDICNGLKMPFMALANKGDCYCSAMVPTTAAQISDSQCQSRTTGAAAVYYRHQGGHAACYILCACCACKAYPQVACNCMHAGCRMQILLLLLLPGLNRQGGTKPLPCHRVYMLKHSFTAPCIRNNPPSTATIAPLKAPPGACAATDPDRGCRLSPIPMSATEWDVPAWSVDRLRWGSKDMVELGMFGVEGARINSKDAFTYGVYSLRAKVNPTSGAVSAFYVSAAGQRRAASCSSSGWMVAVLVAAGAEALGMAFPAQSLGSEAHSPSLCAFSQRGVAVAAVLWL
jgi:hypothetical protein